LKINPIIDIILKNVQNLCLFRVKFVILCLILTYEVVQSNLSMSLLKPRLIKKAELLFLAFLIANVCASCAYKSRNTLFDPSKKVLLDSLKDIYVIEPGTNQQKYQRLAVDDILTIRNLQNADLVTGISLGTTFPSYGITYRIEVDSTVALPVIGRTKLVGLTILEAEKKITELYTKGSLSMINPIFDISVINTKVTVLGEVGRQGNYLLAKERTNLIEILGEAGGINARANRRTIQIIRGDKSNPEVFYVNLKNINSLKSDKINLQNNDIIYVQPNRFSINTDATRSFLPFIQLFTTILSTILIYNRIAR